MLVYIFYQIELIMLNQRIQQIKNKKLRALERFWITVFFKFWKKLKILATIP